MDFIKSLQYKLQAMIQDYRLNVKSYLRDQPKGIALIFVIVLLFMLGVGLRMSAVDFTSLQQDEYYHLATAESILQGEFGNLERDNTVQFYTRAPIVSLLITVTAFIAGSYEPWGLLPLAMFNVLSGVFLYLYLKNFSKFAGLSALIIWIFAPLILAQGSYIREYSLFLFMNITWVYIFLKRFRKSFDQTIQTIQISKQLIFLFLLPALYFLIDFRSTFGNTVALYLGLFAVIVMYYTKIHPILKIALVAGQYFVVYGLMGFLLQEIGRGDIHTTPKLAADFLAYFIRGEHTFANGISEQYSLPVMIGFIFLVITGLLVSFTSKRIEIRVIATIGISYFIFYGFYFNRYFEHRYYIYSLIWTTLLIALALNFYTQALIRSKLIKQLNIIRPFYIYSLSVFCVFLLFGNFYITSPNSIEARTTEQKIFHTDKLKDYTFLDTIDLEIDEETALITPNEHIVLWHFLRRDDFNEVLTPDDTNMYYLFNHDLGYLDWFMVEKVARYDRGYFLLDKFWYVRELELLEPVADKQLCKVFENDFFVIIEWGKMPILGNDSIICQ